MMSRPRHARAEDVRRLDRLASPRVKFPPPRRARQGRRAQRRRDDVGLGHRDVVHARRDDHDQGESDDERQRPGVGGRLPRTASTSRSIPNENSTFEIPIPTRDDPKKMSSRFPQTQARPSNFWGSSIVHSGVSDPHNAMFDTQGPAVEHVDGQPGRRAGLVQGRQVNKFAEYFPVSNPSNRQASYYDPKTGKWELIDTCFGTHHLQFGEDPNEMLYFSGGGPTIPWVNIQGLRPDARATSRRRRAGARRSSTPTATARSPSRGTSRSAAPLTGRSATPTARGSIPSSIPASTPAPTASS